MDFFPGQQEKNYPSHFFHQLEGIEVKLKKVGWNLLTTHSIPFKKLEKSFYFVFLLSSPHSSNFDIDEALDYWTYLQYIWHKYLISLTDA